MFKVLNYIKKFTADFIDNFFYNKLDNLTAEFTGAERIYHERTTALVNFLVSLNLRDKSGQHVDQSRAVSIAMKILTYDENFDIRHRSKTHIRYQFKMLAAQQQGRDVFAPQPSYVLDDTNLGFIL